MRERRDETREINREKESERERDSTERETERERKRDRDRVTEQGNKREHVYEREGASERNEREVPLRKLKEEKAP